MHRRHRHSGAAKTAAVRDEDACGLWPDEWCCVRVVWREGGEVGESGFRPDGEGVNSKMGLWVMMSGCSCLSSIRRFVNICSNPFPAGKTANVWICPTLSVRLLALPFLPCMHAVYYCLAVFPWSFHQSTRGIRPCFLFGSKGRAKCLFFVLSSRSHTHISSSIPHKHSPCTFLTTPCTFLPCTPFAFPSTDINQVLFCSHHLVRCALCPI